MGMMSISMSCKDEYENDLGAGAVIRLCTPGTLMLPLYKVKKKHGWKKKHCSSYLPPNF